jgi:uncharacterized protein
MTAEKIKGSFKSIYDKLIGINDSPQKIALGFGLGVFCGILPGTGPIASVVLALVFRMNKAAALVGSVLTNTWLSLVTFVIAVKIGSALTGANWQDIYQQCQALIQNFSWTNVRTFPFSKIVLPLVIGYLVVGVLSGIIGYVLALLLIRRKLKAGAASHNRNY